MAKYIISLGICWSLNCETLFGQSLPSIQLDRPDQTECPFITPRKYIQIENGFTIENHNQFNRSISYPSTLWKYGVNDKMELRLITEIISEKSKDLVIRGISPITFGFKTTLIEENGILPKTSFIGHITTSKTGSNEFQTQSISPSFRLTMQHNLSDKLTIAYNLGADWADQQTYIYTLTSGLSLSKKVGCYAEVYGFLPKHAPADHRADGGFTYLVNNDFMLDLSGGIGLTPNAPKNYLSLGLSYRFKAIK